MERDILLSASERAAHMSRSIEQFESQLKNSETFRNAFLAVVDLVCQCRIPNAAEDSSSGRLQIQTLHFAAVGKSGGVAQVLVSMLASVGINARFLHPTEALHGDLGSVVAGDPVILISNNGRSAELLAVAPLLRERGCRLVIVTSRLDSPLAQLSKVVLSLPPHGEACPLNQAPLTSTVATLALGQLLVAASMERRLFDLSSYARNHPGGAIGKRIFVRVDDLMVCGNFLPFIGPEAKFKDVISRMTEYALGALIVVDQEERILGIVAERDLRTAMEAHGPAVFDCLVTEFMNPRPITLASGTLAVEALQKMESRPRPLNAVPIVNQDNKAVGLLRLHDLVAAGITSSS